MPEPRDAIKRMRPYSPPTGNRHHSLRLDFNENTVGCSPRVTAAIRSAVTGDLLSTYPDYEATRRALAQFFSVPDSKFLLTNGTDEAIQVLVNAYVESGDEVIILTPSYAMHRFYSEVAGAQIVEVAYGRNDGQNDEHGAMNGDMGNRDLSFNLDPVLAAITMKTKAILLSNPNNPTGTAISESDVLAVLDAAPNACVLVDEAYFEFYGKTVLPLIDSFDNLFVSRTFSKAYGMAALRIGCLFSCAKNVAAMRKSQSPYSVNALAALAVREAIQDQRFTRNYVTQALAGRAEVSQALARLGRWQWPSEANFILFDAGERGDECLSKCREAGVLIRDRRHEIPGALRITAGPPEQVRRCIAVLDDVFGGHSS